MFKNIEFANPEFLPLLLLLPLIAWWYKGKYKTHYAPITMSNWTIYGQFVVAWKDARFVADTEGLSFYSFDYSHGTSTNPFERR
jgi:hypothetical protein